MKNHLILNTLIENTLTESLIWMFSKETDHKGDGFGKHSHYTPSSPPCFYVVRIVLCPLAYLRALSSHVQQWGHAPYDVGVRVSVHCFVSRPNRNIHHLSSDEQEGLYSCVGET